MKISVFGLGYVGAVTAGCLTRQGHVVTGVDVAEAKVEALRRGESPIIEPGLGELLAEGRRTGRLEATTDAAAAIRNTDMSFVCVGTPSAASGALDLRYVNQVAAQIGAALRAGGGTPKRHTVVFRSTMLPGSTAGIVRDCFQNVDVGGAVAVYYFPEFLREGTAVEDFLQPSLVVVGTGPQAGTSLGDDMGVVAGSGARVVGWAEAEMVKYACNGFHALKVAFANEVGRAGKQAGVDAAAVMGILCADTRLNISAAYLRPGNPFGGSCLPKDVRALAHFGRQQGVALPVVESLLPSNEQHLRALLHLVERTSLNEVVILGLSFKADTDDLRESPMVEVAQHLLGRGYRLRIYDPQLNLANLVGSNKRVIDTRMPHLATLLHADLRSALGDGGVILAAQRCARFEDLKSWVRPGHRVIDINGWPELRGLSCAYEGFCW